MQLEEAKEAATSLLSEERVRPTIGYYDNFDDLAERVGKDRSSAIFLKDDVRFGRIPQSRQIRPTKPRRN